MNKSIIRDIFNDELKIIDKFNQEISQLTVNVLHDLADDGFWVNSASKTGVHHPKTSNVYGGNIIHTKHAFYIALTLISADPIFLNLHNTVACILSSILLHDILKFSNTLESHGTIAANKILIYVS